MKKLFFDCGTRDATASLGLLALRVMTGLMLLIGHGIPKITNFASRKELFYVPEFFPFKYLSPAVSLMLCIGAEVVATAFVILGFATRPSAFVVALTMVVAAFGYLGATPWFLTTPTLIETKELSLMYLIPMVALILSGPGGYSVDAMIWRDSKRRRW